jgi:hypothetical protein
MHAMPEVQGVASGRTLSAGAMLVFGAGFALYQLTSLVLGPVSSRQLDLSLTIPGVDVQDLSEPLTSNIRVVGVRTTPAAPASSANRMARSSRASSTRIPSPSSHQLPIVAPKPEPTVVPKPEPTAVPKPEPAVVPAPESHSDASQLNDND